jgi:hypothetical protein
MADINIGKLEFPTKKTPERALIFGAADTVKSFTIHTHNRIHSIAVHHPVFTNPVTLTVSVENDDGRPIYASDSIANPAVAAVELLAQLEQYISINNECTVKATLSGLPGGSGGTVNISIVLCQ